MAGLHMVVAGPVSDFQACFFCGHGAGQGRYNNPGLVADSFHPQRRTPARAMEHPSATRGKSVTKNPSSTPGRAPENQLNPLGRSHSRWSRGPESDAQHEENQGLPGKTSFQFWISWP